jgi:hypothetical protein
MEDFSFYFEIDGWNDSPWSLIFRALAGISPNLFYA